MAVNRGIVYFEHVTGFRFNEPFFEMPAGSCDLSPQIFRFRTDANEGGVEKLSVTVPNKAWLETPYKELAPLVEGAGFLLGIILNSFRFCSQITASCLPIKFDWVHNSSRMLPERSAIRHLAALVRWLRQRLETKPCHVDLLRGGEKLGGRACGVDRQLQGQRVWLWMSMVSPWLGKVCLKV